MKKYMMEHQDEEIAFSPKYSKYYFLHYDKSGKVFLMPEENTAVTERELRSAMMKGGSKDGKRKKTDQHGCD